MKKLLAVILASLMLIMAGCSSKNTSKADSGLLTETEQETSAAQTEASEELAEKNDAESTEMIKNGDFGAGLPENWSTFTQGGEADIFIRDGQLVVSVKKTGSVEHGVQLYQDGFSLEQGCKYKMSFDAYSTIPRKIEYRVQLNGGDYHAYNSQIVDLTTSIQTFTFEFEMTEASDPAPRLAFNLGLPKGVDSLEAHEVMLDNIVLEMTDSSNKAEEKSQAKSPDISVDQIGYVSGEKKTAVFRGDNIDKTFEIINSSNEKVVYTGEIKGSISNSTAGEINAYGDFSDLKVEGTYYIQTKNLGKSYEFKIGSGIYDSAFNDVVKMLYLQRCGCEIPADKGGDFAHSACHTSKATIYGTSTKIDVTGGWHDAGDYGRYVVPGAKTVADLFLAYEMNPSAFSDNTGIPESGNSMPDVLDEARYELEWMLKMQDKTSGGVYHKVTCANFPGMVMPQDEKDELIVSPVSVTATEDFAAVMALSSRIFAKTDKTFSDKCLKASQKAFDYVEKLTAKDGFKNPSGIVTGEYPDSVSRDERFWASAELFRATHEKKYNDIIKEQIQSALPEGLGWADMGYYGSMAYLNTDKSVIDKTIYDKIKNQILNKAKEILKKSKSDGYFISMGDKYPWGSNMTVANNAELLIMADYIEPNGEYIQSAREHLHYLFGRNPMAISYVTGYGTVSPVNTHHRPSVALKKTMPGMLVGGPDSSLEDPFAAKVLAGQPAAKCYADNSQSYSTNEITIYWNSPLIVMMSELK